MVQNQPASGIAPAGQLPTQFDVFGNPIFNIDWGVGGAAMSAGTNYANNILAQQDAQRNSIFADQTRLAGANTAGMVTPEMQAWIARNIGGNTGEAAPSGFDALNAHFTAQSGDDAPYGSWNVAQGGTNAGYGKANDIRRDTTAENAKTVRTILSQMFPNATTGQMDAAANAAMQASVGDAGHYTEVHNPIDIVTGIAQQMGGVPQQFQANLDAMRPQFNQRIEQITAARNGNEDAADQLPAYVKMIAAAAGGLVLGPALGAAFGGGAAGAGTLSGALASAGGNFLGSAITSALTGGDFLRDGLLSGAAAGIGNYASSLDGGANAYGQSMADGTNWGTTAVRDGILPSASQLVNAGGKAGVGMLAGQDATQALTGAGLNLAGITGNNTLKDAGLDPRLAGVATSAGLGLLTGRDPSSIALSSLPALGSYAGSLLGSPSSASTESSGNPTEWTPDNAQWLQNLTGQIAAQGNPAQSFDMGDTSWLDSLISNNTGATDMPYFLPPPSNNPDEWGGLFDDTQLPPFNLSDYLPADLGQVAPDGNLPGTNSSWQSVLDQISGQGQNKFDPTSLGGYGNTADANSGSGLSALLAKLGLSGSAAGAAGGTLLGGLGAAGLGAALGSINGSKQSGTSVTTTEPWSAQQPYLKDLFAKAQSTYNGQPSINPLQTQALSEAGQSADPTAGWFGAGGKVGTNPYAGSNPYLQQSIDYANEDTNRAFMPLMNQANHQSGSFGNSGVADYYSKNLAEQFGRNSTTARMQDYTQQQQLGESDINRRYGAAMNTPTLANQTLQNSQNKFNLGTSAQNQPYDALKQYGSLITGNYGQTSSSPVYTNPLSGLLGGAVAGSSVYSNIFGKGG